MKTGVWGTYWSYWVTYKKKKKVFVNCPSLFPSLFPSPGSWPFDQQNAVGMVIQDFWALAFKCLVTFVLHTCNAHSCNQAPRLKEVQATGTRPTWKSTQGSNSGVHSQHQPHAMWEWSARASDSSEPTENHSPSNTIWSRRTTPAEPS